MAPAAIAFDLDGTVWDSYPWYSRLLGALSGTDPNEFERALRSRQNLMTLADSRVGRSRFVREAAREAVRIPLYAGVVETLVKLRRRGTPLGVASNLSAALVDVMLSGAGIKRFFQVVVDASTRPPKPNPRPLLVACAHLNLEPTKAVYYVGDRRQDQRAAAAAGVSFAWASYGYVDDVDLDATDVRLTEFAQILEL